MRRILILIPIVFLLISCNKLNTQVQGDWAIDGLEANFIIITNGLNLKKDQTCCKCP